MLDLIKAHFIQHSVHTVINQFFMGSINWTQVGQHLLFPILQQLVIQR